MLSLFIDLYGCQDMLENIDFSCKHIFRVCVYCISYRFKICCYSSNLTLYIHTHLKLESLSVSKGPISTRHEATTSILVPAENIHFALIFRYIAIPIHTFGRLSLYSIRISSKYFNYDIYLVHVPLGRLKYFKIHT